MNVSLVPRDLKVSVRPGINRLANLSIKLIDIFASPHAKRLKFLPYMHMYDRVRGFALSIGRCARHLPAHPGREAHM